MTVPTSEDYVYALFHQPYTGMDKKIMGVYRSQEGAQKKVADYLAEHLRVHNKPFNGTVKWELFGTGEWEAYVTELDANFRIVQYRIED